MSRSSARQCLAPGTRVAPGEVLVATEIGDPAQGPLPCPAAPLVAGVLERRGLRVRYGPVANCAEVSQADDGAMLFVTSSLKGDGQATGIGAAADAVDGVAAAAARGAVEEWSAVVGPRRLLGAGSPWCQGAAAALERLRRAAAVHATICVYGWLAASPRDRAELQAAGVVFVNALDEVPDGAVLFVPAHGAAPALRDEASRRGLTVVDATCPLVTAVNEEVRRFAARGDQVMIIGHAGHAVVPGMAGQAPGHTAVVESPAGAGAVGVADPRRVSYVVQPGIPVEETAAVSAALRSRLPGLRDPDPDGFCYAASDRAEAVRAVAAACDVVFVLGSEDEPDTRMLTGLVRARHAKAHAIRQACDIVPSWLAGTSAVGVAETVCARPGLATEVTAALSGLGPLSVTRRRVTTEVAGRRPVGAGGVTG